MEKIKIKAVRSDGQEFEYESAEWGINSVTGIEFPVVEVFTSPRGMGDGDIITGKRKGSRPIEITARLRNFWGEIQFKHSKDKLIGFHNSNFTFDLHFTLFGVTRIARDCEITSANFQQIQVADSIPFFTVAFLSPHADLFGKDEVTTSIVNRIPMWHCTRVYTADKTNAFGLIEVKNEGFIDYYGTEDAPIIVKLTASGFVSGITIELNENSAEFKSYELEMSAGDVVYFNTQNKTVVKNITLLSPSFTPIKTMDLMKLHYGENRFKISATTGNDAFRAEVSYIGRYGGI